MERNVYVLIKPHFYYHDKLSQSRFQTGQAYEVGVELLTYYEPFKFSDRNYCGLKAKVCCITTSRRCQAGHASSDSS